jgi:hypothetical protein
VLDLEQGKIALHRGHDESIVFTERDGVISGENELQARMRDGYRRLDYFEKHCFLARTSALRAVGPLPPLSTHEHVYLCIELWKRGALTYLDSGVRVFYAGSPPLPLRDFEQDYFRFRWDMQRAHLSHVYVRARWRIAELFEPSHFIHHQLTALSPETVLTRYDSSSVIDEWPEEFQAA